MFRPDPRPVKVAKKPKLTLKWDDKGLKKDLHTFAKAMTKLAKKPIRKVSKVKAKELKTYFQKRQDFLSKHTTCQAKLIGCTGQVNDLHHCAKRGKNLNEETTFLAVCRKCHNQIEFVLTANERREKGFLK